MRRLVVVVAGLLALVLVGAAVLLLRDDRTALPVPVGRYEFGVLIADEQRLQSDRTAGVQLAVLELRWDEWQPSASATDAAYRQAQIAKATRYAAAGYRVAVDIGLQHPPGWVLDLPNGRLRSQDGQLSATANVFFSDVVRRAAGRFIDDVVGSLDDLAYVRVGLSGNGETLYPEAPSGQWWAFDDLAQGRVAGRPARIGNPPLPGWVPGTPTYAGRPVTPAEAQSWYDWYLGASVDAHAWEIRAFRDAGYRGEIQLVTPGIGVTPHSSRRRLDALLDDRTADRFHTMNTAADWPAFLDGLLGRVGDDGPLVLDISSVADDSGSHRTSHCRPGDGAVDFRTDRDIERWSSVRWLAYLAARHGLPTLGENPGNSDVATLDRAFGLMASCRLRGLMWAWDFQLYDGRHATVSDLAQRIRASSAEPGRN